MGQLKIRNPVTGQWEYLATGVTGEQGLTGVLGITGERGITGAMGVTGLTGAVGPTGVVGSTGTQGHTGVQGATGQALPQGVTGAQGITGAKGITGTTGQGGPQGVTGRTGPQGITGAQGVTGTVGITGAVGVTGANYKGVTGTTGNTYSGATGIQGTTGSTGAAGTAGVAGPQGVTGVTGVQGVTGTYPQNVNDAYGLGPDVVIKFKSPVSGDGYYSGLYMDAQVGANVSIGTVVSHKASDNKWYPASAGITGIDAAGSLMGLVGVSVKSTSSGNTGTIMLWGTLNAAAIFPTFTVNNYLYASGVTGGLTSTAPTGENSLVKIVGFALSGDEIYIFPSMDYVKN